MNAVCIRLWLCEFMCVCTLAYRIYIDSMDFIQRKDQSLFCLLLSYCSNFNFIPLPLYVYYDRMRTSQLVAYTCVYVFIHTTIYVIFELYDHSPKYTKHTCTRGTREKKYTLCVCDRSIGRLTIRLMTHIDVQRKVCSASRKRACKACILQCALSHMNILCSNFVPLFILILFSPSP